MNSTTRVINFAWSLQFFTPTTLAAMWRDLDDSPRDDDTIDAVWSALVDLVGEAEAQELVSHD